MSTPIVSEKRCTKCGVEKPVSEFHKNVQSKDGLRPDCKHCLNASAAAYRKANPDKIKASNAAWYAANHEKARAGEAARYAANPDKFKACVKVYYAANSENIKVRNREYNATNSEKVAASKAAYRSTHKEERAAYCAAHKEEIAARSAAYRKANPEKVAARKSAWQRANPEKAKAQYHRRRARKLNAAGTHTAQQIIDLLQKQRCKCAYCRKNIKYGYHIDHIVALANGGGNDIYNLQLLCPSCNCKKQAMCPFRFAQQRGMLL